MVLEGTVLPSNGCDRQRRESTITAREPGPSPDLPHQVVRRDFSVGVGHCGRFGLHDLAPDLSRSNAMIVTSAHLNPLSSEPWRQLSDRSGRTLNPEKFSLDPCPSFTLTPRRDGERKRRAHADLALHPDPSSVELDELPTERQAQSRAPRLPLRRAYPPKLLEYRVLVLRSNSD